MVQIGQFNLPTVTPADQAQWTTWATELGLNDFDPTSVDWNSPVKWKSEASGGAIMTAGAGYGIECGFGVFFSLVTVLLTYLEGKFAGVVTTSEHFNTAGREVKTGLTASVIVSQWTWAATLLQSSNVAWQYGVTGPYWYAAGASIQVLVFGILAIELKRKASNAHTFLEMIDVRWGKCAHLTFMWFGICTNVIVSSMLLLGGCAVMKDAAGIDIRVSGVLIPLGTVFYTLVGGLKATFLASYIHTTIIFIGLVIFVTAVYVISPDCSTSPTTQCNSLGSASVMYERLAFLTYMPVRVGDADVIKMNPTTGMQETVSESGFHQGPAVLDGGTLNRGGSYLTMMSTDGIMFGIINIVGNFGTVFVDQSYWQSAIAASPASAHKGYLLGGLVWFTIPFTLATSLGLAGNALNVALTKDDANAGLVPPAAATVLLGRGGGVFMIIMLFMAITSTGSAEMIAVSSLWSYDVYRKYINPQATGPQILRQARFGIAAWAFLMFWFNWILWEIGLSLGWVYNFMGIVIGGAVWPVACVLMSKRMSAIAAISGAVGSTILAVITWLVIASTKGPVSVATTGHLHAQLGGNCVALGSSIIICTVMSCLFPQNYDWEDLNKGITLVEKEVRTLGAEWESTPEFLDSAAGWIFKNGCGWSIWLIIGWPVLCMPWGVFTESIYAIWASVALCWGYIAAIVIVSLPLWENRETIYRVLTCNPMSEEEIAAKNAEVTTTETTTASA